MKSSGEISAGQFPGRGVLGVDPLQFRPVVVFTSFQPITAGSTAASETALMRDRIALARFLIGAPHQATKPRRQERLSLVLPLHRVNGMPVRIGLGALLTVGTSSCLRSAAHFGAEFRRWPFTR